MHNFNLEYSALPGDISNAYNFFGTDCDSVASYCNGNGDGLISTSSDSNDDETNRFWQHLYLSGYLNDYSSNSTIVLASSTEIGKPGPLIDKLIYEKSNLLKCPLVIISGNLSDNELESIV